MIDERALIARVESANADDFAGILRRATADEERALRVHFGDAQFERLRALATTPSAKRAARAVRGNVVVLHGIMGGELTVREPKREQHVWMNIPRLVLGAVGWLPMNPDGTSHFDVRATGILKKYYGEIVLALRPEWNVQAFWYDWRKDLRASAADLHRAVNGWFGGSAPVHFVAHSMGGLVVRTFIHDFPQRWRSGGRLVMLGTPNHGSFAIPQVITGAKPIVRHLATLDLKHKLPELLHILNSFPGSCQMLPSPLVMESMAPLYRASTFGSAVRQQLLDHALQHHRRLAGVVDVERMSYIAGANQSTHINADLNRLDVLQGYSSSLEGDGTVPHLLGRLKDRRGNSVPMFYLDCEHGNLPRDKRVMAATAELLATGTCSLRTTPGTRARGAEAAKVSRQLREIETEQAARDEMELRAIAERLRPRARGVEAEMPLPLTRDERRAQEIILSDFLGTTIPPEEEPAAPLPKPTAGRQPPDRIEIALLQGGIEAADTLVKKGDKAIDALAVGHYLNVKPQNAELALDRAISAELPGAAEPSDLLITQYTERGILRGELGQPFLMPDLRRAGRVIAIAGMGAPGRFGVPELTVLAHELCWTLGRMGKSHLATVLIGAGAGNLGVQDAIGAWIRGIRRATAGTDRRDRRHLARITFVEFDPRNVLLIDEALRHEQEKMRGSLTIDYQPLSDKEIDATRNEGLRRSRAELREQWKKLKHGRPASADEIPVRVSISVDRKSYQFAALTSTAAIPQREIAIDPRLIEQANNELAAATTRTEQLESGRLLEQLLVPEDIRHRIYTGAPLVLMLDATTARIHWELVARTDRRTSVDSNVAAPSGNPGAGELDEDSFLGTSRGLTRQLRTTFAPPPEPPPPPRRHLRVLVVADPAEDAPLPGAQQEGEETAELFEKFKDVYRDGPNTVEVVRLFGAYEATRTRVLRHLLFTNFDVLHFAGHCVFDKEEPENSGWIFSGGERLTARELSRVDRVPKFIFSNACESGITPDRSELRSPALAPSFAEAFFQRGVANFVCTAWPVDDLAARMFARRVYSGLLGLLKEYEPEPMHVAMRQARLEVAREAGGEHTWGAYQHYGDPYFRFFDAATMRPAPPPARKKSGARKSSRKSRAPAARRKSAKKPG